MNGGEEYAGYGAEGLEGTVENWNEARGFGFIQPDESDMTDGQRVFVHYSGVHLPGRVHLYPGDRVRFTLEFTERGPRAKDVEVLERATVRY